LAHPVHTRWIPDLCCKLHYFSRQRTITYKKTFPLAGISRC